VALQATGDWLIENDSPAMVSVQLRWLPVLLADTDTVTGLLPVPLVGETVTHDGHGLFTVQVQSLDVVMLTVVLPPPDGAIQPAGKIE